MVIDVVLLLILRFRISSGEWRWRDKTFPAQVVVTNVSRKKTGSLLLDFITTAFLIGTIAESFA